MDADETVGTPVRGRGFTDSTGQEWTPSLPTYYEAIVQKERATVCREPETSSRLHEGASGLYDKLRSRIYAQSYSNEA